MRSTEIELNNLALIQTSIPIVSTREEFVFEAKGCYFDDFYNAYVECVIGYDQNENIIGMFRGRQKVNDIILFDMLALI